VRAVPSAALVLGVVVLVLLVCPAAPADKPARIGVLATAAWPPFDSLRAGLRDLGYVEGGNLAIEYRWTEGRDERFSPFAAQLVALKVDLIVTWGTEAAAAAKAATTTVPVVMAASGDPVGTGLVAGYARPGGNLTGMSALNPDLEGRRLELLKEVVPRLARVALLGRRGSHLYALMLSEARRSAQRLGVRLSPIEVLTAAELPDAFVRMTRERTEALVVAPDTVFVRERAQLAELAIKQRLPSIFLHTEHVVAGGLMAYGPDYHDLFRRAASYVDKILKGARPADLPIQQPRKFELLINLKTARAMGLTVPPSLLLRADKIVQ